MIYIMFQDVLQENLFYNPSLVGTNLIASAHVNRGYKSLCRSAPNHESFLSSGSVFLRI